MPWKGSMAMRSLVKRSTLTGPLFEEQEKPGKSLIYPFLLSMYFGVYGPRSLRHQGS